MSRQLRQSAGVQYYVGSYGSRGFTDQREILVALVNRIRSFGEFADPSYINIGKRDSLAYPQLPIDTMVADVYPTRKIVDQDIFAGAGTNADIRTEHIAIRVYVQEGRDFSDYLEIWATDPATNAYLQARRVYEGLNGFDIIDESNAILTVQPCRVIEVGDPQPGPQGWTAIMIVLEVMYRERDPYMP